MRILILALAALLLAAPAWADVEITLTETAPGSDVIEIGYSVTGETELVRAFALNIAATDGNIIAIENFAIGDNNGGFGIFPGAFAGNISVNPTTGDVDNWVGNPNPYTPLAPTGYPDGSDLPAATITTECGSLYTTNAPGNSGLLFTITVEDTVTKVCVTGNAIRGNVVLENASEATLTPAEACIEIPRGPDDCFPTTPDYALQRADWEAMGKPDCWCGKGTGVETIDDAELGYQCDGDANSDEQVVGWRVYSNDLVRMSNSWQKKTSDLGNGLDPCSDFDHKGQVIDWRVYSDDLVILAEKWQDNTATLPGDCPRPDVP